MKAEAGKLDVIFSCSPCLKNDLYNRLTHNACDGNLWFIKPTFIYGKNCRWLENWAYTMKQRGVINEVSLGVYRNTNLQTLQSSFSG